MFIKGAFILPHPPLILPGVGRGKEREIDKTITAYTKAARLCADIKPDTIVVISPHSVCYSDYFHISPGERAHGDMSRFGARGETVDAVYDTGFVRELSQNAERDGVRAGTLGERDSSLDHGTVIPLRFIDAQGAKYKLVRIGLSGLSVAEHYKLGMCIAKTAEELKRRTVIIASGDLSHKLKPDGPYGYAAEGPEFDAQVTQAMRDADFYKFMSFSPSFCEKAAECGLRSFLIMAGAFDGLSVKSELLSYEGVTGVGYAVADFFPGEPDESRCFLKKYAEAQQAIVEKRRNTEDEYVRLARLSLEAYVRTHRRAAMPESLPPELTQRAAGVFVSVKKHGQLRGCIGTIKPVTECIAAEIMRNAVSSATEDPLFSPIEPYELDELTYSVDVLGETEHISSSSELDTGRYGVIVTRGMRRGLLLPNLEGVDTVEKQISIAKQKAGIAENEPCSLERFEVVRHK